MTGIFSLTNLSQFKDEFVSKGEAGGIEAGHKFRTTIEDYCRTLSSYRPDDRMFIQVYADLRALGRAYHQARIIPEESSFVSFAAGFGSSNDLTSYIDAGSQKEAVESKMRGK